MLNKDYSDCYELLKNEPLFIYLRGKIIRKEKIIPRNEIYDISREYFKRNELFKLLRYIFDIQDSSGFWECDNLTGRATKYNRLSDKTINCLKELIEKNEK